MKMKSDRLGLIHKDQRAVTLVELMIAIALAGIVTAGVTMLISNVFGESTRTSNHRIALSQVQSAGYWVSRDALQAQPPLQSELGEPSGFPLSLTWLEEPWTRVVYTLEDGRLRRTHQVELETLTDTIVAEFIDHDHTECYLDGAVLVFHVTATVGQTSVTMDYEVKPRLAS